MVRLASLAFGCGSALAAAAATGPAAPAATITVPLRKNHSGLAAAFSPSLAARLAAATAIATAANATTGALGADPIPAGGNVWPVAIYWVEVQVGSPPVSHPAAVDSGSSTLDIGAVGCAGCSVAAPNVPYDTRASSAAAPVAPYTFSNTYETCDLASPTAPCTIKGKLYADAVSLGGAGPVTVHVGAIDSQTTNFDQFNHVCGVMGFAGTGPGTVIAQLVAAGHVASDGFGLCLNEAAHKSNGTLTLGAPDARLYTGDLAYVPQDTSGGYGGLYQMPLRGITLNGTALAVENKVAILDSGTNVLLLPTPAFSSLRRAMTDFCAAPGGAQLHGVCDVPAGATFFDGVCFAMTTAQLAAFPPLALEVQGASLKMGARNYFKRGAVGSGATAPDQYCLAVRDTGANGFLIIGDTTMENYYVHFDRANKQIGWAAVNEKNCGEL